MKFYAGIDLHSNNSVLAIINEAGEKIYQKRLANDLSIIANNLLDYQYHLEGIVIESTFNWYWLVDGLIDKGYCVHLLNPSAIQQYNGLKHTDDASDALWLAEILRLNIVPESYIYPKETRALRDLLRKRAYFVRKKTDILLSMENIFSRETGQQATQERLLKMDDAMMQQYFPNSHTQLAITASKRAIQVFTEEIIKIEKVVKKEVKETQPAFKQLQTVPGIGVILSLTIVLETGNIERFSKVGQYSSYCRCVKSTRLSNSKIKGKNNTKNGNKYLSWAFVEAAHFAIRYDEKIKSYYQRKRKKTNIPVAIKTIAHKLARASYYIIKDGVDFDVNKAFC